ncbi:acyl-CoA carboxylase subunit epsilon [Streptomyces sp. NPDC093252]|uniref:acyl-CoA carboxylase subunit epsilon n=1 Tax=Streptomyces sp. NPDC093252 TaxID=3154980 RepID=UPI003422C027
MSIKVIRGNPTPEELAAALAVVRARAAATDPPPDTPAPRDSWSDPSRIARGRVPHPGPTAWPRTYWPS